MKVEYFATFRELTGVKAETYDGGDVPVSAVLQYICERHPALRDALFASPTSLNKFIKILVNGKDIRGLNGLDTIVQSSDEIALFPPVAGG